MTNIITLKMAFVTIAFAIAAGFYVQYGASEGSADTAALARAVQAPQTRALLTATSPDGTTVFGLPDVTTRPVNHTNSSRSTVPVRSVYAELDVPPFSGLMATPIAGCDAAIAARRSAFATVDLAVTLPCAPNRHVVIQHEGLRISGQTDADGHLQINLPAVTVEAEFTVLLNNIEYARVSLPVPAVRNYHRAILHWRGDSNLQLHAFEAGATVGDAGHIWSASAPDNSGERGFVQRYGLAQLDLPYLAEVLTYPAERGLIDDHLSLQVGVTLAEKSCGQALRAGAYQVYGGEVSQAHTISASIPRCDGEGKIVMIDWRSGQTLQALR